MRSYFIVTLLSITHYVIPSAAFAPCTLHQAQVCSASSTKIHFGIPTFGGGDNKDEESKDKKIVDGSEPEKKIGMSGLFQLITAGMGSPFLGDYQGVDKETGNMMFTLEANNFMDENGDSPQLLAKHFEDGWVDEEEEKRKKEKKEKGDGKFKFW